MVKVNKKKGRLDSAIGGGRAKATECEDDTEEYETRVRGSMFSQRERGSEWMGEKTERKREAVYNEESMRDAKQIIARRRTY